MQTGTTPPRRRWLKWLIGTALLPLLIFALYLAFVLNWSYSDGDRAGYLQKFSRKGWVCKTYEGELAMTTVPGVAPVLWNFTVRDDAVAAQSEEHTSELQSPKDLVCRLLLEKKKKKT